MGESNQIQNNNKIILPILLVILIGLVSYFGYTIFIKYNQGKVEDETKFEEISLKDSVVKNLYRIFSTRSLGYNENIIGIDYKENQTVTASSLLEEQKMELAILKLPEEDMDEKPWNTLTDEKVTQILGNPFENTYIDERFVYVNPYQYIALNESTTAFSEESLLNSYKVLFGKDATFEVTDYILSPYNSEYDYYFYDSADKYFYLYETEGDYNSLTYYNYSLYSAKKNNDKLIITELAEFSEEGKQYALENGYKEHTIDYTFKLEESTGNYIFESAKLVDNK